VDCGRLRRESSFHAQSGSAAMEEFIHRENLILFRKRLAEPRTEAQREMLVKLLAEEEAKVLPSKNGILPH
jgi:hypothetical protein